MLNKIVLSLILIPISLLGFNSAVYANESGNYSSRKRIDKQLFRYFDVTGDGKNETILLHVHAQNIEAPFFWTLEIKEDDKVIFRHESNDKDFNEIFNEPSYFDDTCFDPVDCKRQYYFHYLLYRPFIRTDMSKNRLVFDRSYLGSIYHVAKRFLMEECGVGEKRAIKIIERMVTRIKSGKAVLLKIPLSPVLDDIPHLYVNEVKRFVPVYSW